VSRDRGAFRHLWASPWTAWVGLRYLRAKKSSKFVSFITFLSVGSVAIGVMAIIVVLCVMDGFEKALDGRLVASDIHILVEPTAKVPGFDGGYVPLQAFQATPGSTFLAKDPRVLAVSPVLSTQAILRTERSVAGVELKGITDERLARLKPHVVESLDPATLTPAEREEVGRLPGLFVGKELAYTVGVIPGEQLTLVSPTEMEGPMGSVPRLKRFFVEGIFEAGELEDEVHTVFSRAPAVQAFLRRHDVASSWEVTLQHYERATEVAGDLRAGTPGFTVRDWKDLNASLFGSLKLERLAMFLILVFIVVVASFNIVTTLSLSVIEKKREISILKAMGARHGQVGAVFLSQGLFIGGVGVGLGAALAGIICLFLAKTDIVQLPDVYYDRTLPVNFVPGYFLGVMLCALSITLLAGIVPTRRAVKLHPLEGIRGGGA
jgi:lipoprotein-releasing system permease protein